MKESQSMSEPLKADAKRLANGRFGANNRANPAGRPRKEASITNVQREMLGQKCRFDSQGRTWLDYLAERGLILAGEKSESMKDLKDRLEGKVLDVFEGQLGGVIKHILVFKENSVVNHN